MQNDGTVTFDVWRTPFQNAHLELERVEYLQGGGLRFWVRDVVTSAGYLVSFKAVSAFRVLDEHGLQELWEKTSELGGRPAASTFKVRNHAWTKESPITFVASDGWSYILATDFDCIEIVSVDAPSIVETREN